MSTLLKMQKFHPLCSRCIGMYPLQNRWTVLRYLQCYENFSECCTHLILPETALFSPTPTFAKEPKNDDRFQYLMAFDNYMKHIKTILITVKNSILLGNTNTFEINSFSYGGVSYPTENALSKIEEIRNYVNDTVDEMLKEILYQLPNCISNGQRIQEIHYKQVYSEYEGKPCVEYISFFIDVPNDISDLPSEIKVYPLIIKPNNEIYSFDFRFDKIFIRKQGSDENAIVGVATLKNGLDTNEFYRVYEVTACRQIDYALYVATFKETYKEQKLHMNIYAMDGTMLFIRDEEQKSE